jgi:hypothetical protein
MADWTKQNLDDYFDALRKKDVSRVAGMFASNATLTDENNRILQGNQIKQYYSEFLADAVNCNMVSFNARGNEVYVAYTYPKPGSSDIVRASGRFFFQAGKITKLILELF